MIAAISDQVTGQSTEQAIVLSLGEWHVTDDPNVVLVCLGLGSCVAISLYDRVSNVGAMAHMVLPDSTAGRPSPGSAKFVDQAVPMLLRELKTAGANVRRLVVDIAGGASMLTNLKTDETEQVGFRNVEAVTKALDHAGLRVRSAETGGQHGRTVRVHIATGELEVSTAGSSVAGEMRRAA